MSTLAEVAKLVGLACIGATIVWLSMTHPINRWRNWRDIRAATQHLDIRNGWIIEHGRNKAIIMLHCGHCRRTIRITDRTSHGPAAQRMINIIAADRCTHKGTHL